MWLRGISMKRLWGLILFCVGVGMAVKVLIPTTLGLLIFIVGLLATGYHLFCRCWKSACFTAKTPGKLPWSFKIVQESLQLSPLDQAGTEARSTYIHLFGPAVYFNFNGLHVSFPHLVGSSMWMAHWITKVSSFFANCTFSHDRTSLTIQIIPC